jgi:hypothetical protein
MPCYLSVRSRLPRPLPVRCMLGKPVIRGTRIPGELSRRKLSGGTFGATWWMRTPGRRARICERDPLRRGHARP